MTEMKVGETLLVETASKSGENLFGRVVYRVVSLEQVRGEPGVKLEIVGGSGPSAAPGRVVPDTVANIDRAIQQGKARKIAASEVASHTQQDTDKPKSVGALSSPHTGTGVVELD